MAIKKLTPQVKAYLSKNAPETLRAPQSKDFTDKASHAKAVFKFKQNGHWATPDPSNADDVKNLSAVMVEAMVIPSSIVMILTSSF